MRPSAVRGFTLIEAVAGAAVLALVIGYLMFVSGPRQRAMARADGCKAHLASLMRAVGEYVEDHRYFPASYVYGGSQAGITWHMTEQGQSTPPSTNGYVHWTGLLSGLGYIVDESTYGCPEVPHTGAPNTNPGPIAANWEPGQVNEFGSGPSTGGLPNDRQAKRLAYTANGAVMPRNKFGTGSIRRNKFFDGHPPEFSRKGVDPSSLIVLTEWAVLPGSAPTGGWAGLTDAAGLYRTHRPITPFLGISAGTNVYNEPDAGFLPRFRYPTQAEILPSNQLSAGFFTSGISELNAVGRHHPGATAHFALMDGNVRQMTVQQSVQERLWGRVFFTITGRNAVVP